MFDTGINANLGSAIVNVDADGKPIAGSGVVAFDDDDRKECDTKMDPLMVDITGDLLTLGAPTEGMRFDITGENRGKVGAPPVNYKISCPIGDNTAFVVLPK